MRRQHRDDPAALRELYELTEDRDALAALDREILHQPEQIETDR